MQNKRLTNFILFIILVIGITLRVKSAIINDFWADEATNFFISKYSSIRDIVLGVADIPHNFLYILLIKGVLQMNTSVLFLRLPSLLFGSINIILVYLISTKLIRNRAFGLVCTLLFSISPYQIEYSWWARMYEMVLFFSLFSVFSLVQQLNSNNKWWGWLFVSSNILGYCTDYSFIWYLVVLNIIYFWCFLRKKAGTFKYLLLSDLLVLLSLPVLINKLPQIFAYYITWIERPDFNILKATLLWFMGLKDFWDRNINNWWLLPLITVVILFIHLVVKKYRHIGLVYISMFSLLIPVGLSYIMSNFLKSSIFLAWNLISISPAVILLEGIIIFSLLMEGKIVYKTIGCLVLGFIIYFNIHLYYNKTSGLLFPRKEGWYYRKTAELLNKTYKPSSEGIIALGFETLLKYYYQGYYLNNYRSDRQLNFMEENDCFSDKFKEVWIVLVPWFNNSINDSISEAKKLERYTCLKNVNFKDLKPYYEGLVVYKVKI